MCEKNVSQIGICNYFASEKNGISDKMEIISSQSLDLDKWIEILLNCKPISEADIQKLCTQVRDNKE
jgi:hypothetical protein